MTKKVLSLILVFSLIALTGCGGNKNVLSSANFDVPKVASGYVAAQNVGASTLQQYIYARLKLEQLLETKDAQQFSKTLNETLEAFIYVRQFSEKSMKMCDYAALADKDNKTTSSIIKTKYNPFAMTAYAADNPQDAKKWAEELTKSFDAAKGNQKIKALSEQLGVDAKEAYKQLCAAQEIIKKGADADAAFFDTAMKAAMATKSTCKVALLVTSTIATGGASLSVSSVAAAANTSAMLINGIDAIVDVGQTASTIILGEDHKITKQLDATAEGIAPIVAVTGLLTCNFKAVGNIGKLTTVKEKAEAIGTINYFAQSAVGLSQGQIMGIDLSKDGKADVKEIEIPKKTDDKADIPALNKTLEKENLPIIPAEDTNLKPFDEFVDEFKKDKPDSAKVLKEIDAALAELKELLIELGLLQDFADIKGVFSGNVTTSAWGMTDTFAVSVTVGEVDVDEAKCPIAVTFGNTTFNTTASIIDLGNDTIQITGSGIQGESKCNYDFTISGDKLSGSFSSGVAPGGNVFGAITGNYTFDLTKK